MTKQAAIKKIAQFIVYRDMTKQAQGYPEYGNPGFGYPNYEHPRYSASESYQGAPSWAASQYESMAGQQAYGPQPQPVPSWATSLAESMTGLQPAGQHSERDYNAELLQALLEGYETPYATGEAGASAGQRVLDDIEAAGAGYQNPGSIALNTTSGPMSPGASAGQQVLQDIGFDPNAQYVNPLEAYLGQPLGVSTGEGYAWDALGSNPNSDFSALPFNVQWPGGR